MVGGEQTAEDKAQSGRRPKLPRVLISGGDAMWRWYRGKVVCGGLYGAVLRDVLCLYSVCTLSVLCTVHNRTSRYVDADLESESEECDVM